MFATKVRERPCSARSNFSSEARSTRICPSSRCTFIRGCSVRLSSPLGPFTLTVLPSTFTVTSFGMATGRRPIRLIPPDRAQDLGTEALPGGVEPGHDALRGRHDGHAEAAPDERQISPAGVDPPSRRRDPLRTGERRDPSPAHVLEAAGERRSLSFKAQEEALRLEDLGDLCPELARGDAHDVVPGTCAVTQAREHVRDGVGHDHATRAPLLLLRRRRARARRPVPAWRGWSGGPD